MTTGLSFSVTCAACGGELEHRRSVKVGPDRGYSEEWCAACLIVWRVEVAMTAVDSLRSLVVADPARREAAARERAGAALGEDVLAVFS